MEDSKVVSRNKDILVTETTLDSGVSIEELVNWALSNRKVGKLVFDVSQGTVQKSSLVESTKISEDRRPATRKAAGV